MQSIRPALALCLAATLTPAAPAVAEEAPLLTPGLVSAEILPGWSNADGTRIAALRIVLAPGWKTYWRVPGDVGVPPRFDFDASGNAARVEVIWPAPEVFETNGMRTVGYHDTLVLPLKITPKDAAQPVALAADLDFGICHDICAPVEISLSAELDGPGAPDMMIEAALQAVPRSRPGLARCRAEPIRDGVRVTAVINFPAAPEEVALLELRSTPMWVSEPEIMRLGATLQASVDFVPDTAQPFDLDQGDLRITVVNRDGAIEIDGCPAP